MMRAPVPTLKAFESSFSANGVVESAIAFSGIKMAMMNAITHGSLLGKRGA